jgi:error-prone DNA polymerase
VAVCGLVIVRQRPGSAKGVLFITLEDETGVVNVVVWSKIYEANRRAVLAGRLLRVTGRVQRDGAVVHVVAERIEDVSHLLDRLTDMPLTPPLAHADEVRRPQPEGSRPQASNAATRAKGLIQRAAPRAMHPREQAKLLFRHPPTEEP